MITDVTQYKKKKLTEKGGNHLARTDGWTKKKKKKNNKWEPAQRNPKNALCSNPPGATRKTVPGAVTTGADRESRHSAAVCKLMIDT